MASRNITTKAHLLSVIHAAWDALQSFLAPHSETQMTTAHDEHGWAVKDHLTHVAAWEESVVAFLQGKPRYQALGVDQALFEGGSFDEMNEVIQRLRQHLSLPEAMAQLESTHTRLISLLEPLSDADLNQPVRHFLSSSPDTDQRRAMDLIYDNTADHYSEHLAWIEALVAPRK
ncbi:MAG: hypothetical protein A2139_14380 [Desulfobacca sp. RBG_16_60_12]|nr:MAG: hypothetical protein A2139_14380 [Desulfobacca sp. RBG_16_60_12]